MNLIIKLFCLEVLRQEVIRSYVVTMDRGMGEGHAAAYDLMYATVDFCQWWYA